MSLLQIHSPLTSPADSDYSSILSSAGTLSCGFLLDHFILVSVGGSDAEKFLQNQFSNDISKIKNAQVQLNAYCNPKGRVLAMLYLVKRPDGGYWMIMPGDLSDALIKRLRIYVMRAKVTIDVEEEQAMIGLLGERNTLTDLSAYSFAGYIKRDIVIGDPKKLYGKVDQLDNVLDSDYWKLCDIVSGLPQVYAKTIEQCIPQHLNMDLVSGISFSKGCYPGQEIIARLRYLGKSKYRLCVASVVSEKMIAPGETLFEKGQPEKKAGLVIDAVQCKRNVVLLSAMLKYVNGKHPAACLNSGDGPELSFGSLPYVLPVE